MSEESGGGVDFALLAQGVEELREAVGAMVAGLVADGFTDREAREIVAAVMRQHMRDAPKEDEDAE